MSDAVTPFEIAIPDADLTDLSERLARTRFPEAEAVDDWSQGIPLAYVQDVAAYWADGYDWRARESHHNQFPQYRTELDGLGVHFIHRPSAHDGALPIVITHGWPGSVVEFHKVIDALADPTAHGGDAADAFHVVCPSLPGYGFSDKPTQSGTGVARVAEMWDQLMVRLGYDRYVAQGGDWGAAVTTYIGMQNLGHCQAIHTNMPVAGPDPATMDDLSEVEQAALESFAHYDQWDSGYSKQQSTRPQTLGYGLVDSPVGQMAWILEKFWAWTDCDGHPENALSRDELLDNVMMYWLTASGASSGRLYWESFADFGSGGVEMPTGCSLFPKEIIRSSQRWAEQRYQNIIYWNELDKGGHFAAFEQPELFIDELRAWGRLVR
ncbi:MAG: epoxide hydrolase family protein [Acidimicrobiales bacterium]